MVIDTETCAEVDAVEELAACRRAYRRRRRAGRPRPSDARVVAVEAHERRQVEGGAEAGLALFEQEAEAFVGLPRRAEAGELPHGPEPAAVHGGVDAARERILAGVAEVGVGVEAVEAVGRVQGFDGHAADGGGRLLAQGSGGVFFLPAFLRRRGR